MPLLQTFEIPVAHVDDGGDVADLIRAMQAIHGPDYGFSVGRWDGDTVLGTPEGRTVYRFVVEAGEASISLQPGDPVRGPSSRGPYQNGGAHAQVTSSHSEALWPGDVIASNKTLGAAEVTGTGVYFEVLTETTAYASPKLSLLRNLESRPGGCAAYPGAFRRETLPPARPADDAPDRVGVNRVNEHTLDMRPDRSPFPKKHYHGPVPGRSGTSVNHSETAIMLPRSVYGLPEVDNTPEGHALIYRNPKEGAADSFTVPVRPGTIVVTPATHEVVYGHCFANAFAMLIAIPGFGGPSGLMDG
jgi:hypothetical protein